MRIQSKSNSKQIVICERIFFEGDWVSNNGLKGRGSVFGFLKANRVKKLTWNFIPFFQYKYAIFFPFVIGTIIAKILYPATAQDLVFHEGKIAIDTVRKLVLQTIILVQLIPLNLAIKNVLYPCDTYEKFLDFIFPFPRKKLIAIPPSIDKSTQSSIEGFPIEFFDLGNEVVPIVGILGRVSTLDPVALAALKEFVDSKLCNVVYAGAYSGDLKKFGFNFVNLGSVTDAGLRAFIEKINLLFCPFKDGVSLKNTTATTALSFGKPIFSNFICREKYMLGLPFECHSNLLNGNNLNGAKLEQEELRATLREVLVKRAIY